MARTYPHMVTLTDYCRHIGIDMPRYPHFDIRRSKDNVDRVLPQMTPFRHECVTISLRTKAERRADAKSDEINTDNMYLFFDSPFKLVSWDERRNWDGYYCLFSQDFIAENHHVHDLLEDFPFLKVPDDTLMDVTPEEATQLVHCFEEINKEYTSDKEDKFEVIVPLVLLVLQYVRRIYECHHSEEELHQASRKADQNLFSRYKELIKQTFAGHTQRTVLVNPHSTTYYAQKLSVHPNYLNAITKKMAGQTALHIIHEHVLLLANTRITQTGSTPMQYRNEHQKDTI